MKVGEMIFPQLCRRLLDFPPFLLGKLHGSEALHPALDGAVQHQQQGIPAGDDLAAADGHDGGRPTSGGAPKKSWYTIEVWI